MNPAQGMFHDPHGKRSLTRLLTAVVVTALIFWPLAMWTVASVCAKPVALVSLPENVVEFVKWSLGFMLAFAAHNKREETKATAAAQPTSVDTAPNLRAPNPTN